MRIGACQIMISGINGTQDYEVVNSRGVHVSSKSERGPSLSHRLVARHLTISMLILHRL